MGDLFSKITKERVFQTKVPAAYMRSFVTKMAEQHDDGNGPVDMHFAAFAAFRATKAKSGTNEIKALRLKDHCLIQAMIERGRALARLVESGATANWQLPAVEGALLHPSIVNAASVAKLYGEENSPTFDPDEFLGLVLEDAPVNQPIPRI